MVGDFAVESKQASVSCLPFRFVALRDYSVGDGFCIRLESSQFRPMAS